MDEFLKLMQQINIGNIIVMGGMIWFLYHRMEKRFDKIDQRLDKMQDAINDIDRRLCRLEGAFQSKDCCMIKPTQYIKQAE